MWQCPCQLTPSSGPSQVDWQIASTFQPSQVLMVALSCLLTQNFNEIRPASDRPERNWFGDDLRKHPGDVFFEWFGGEGVFYGRNDSVVACFEFALIKYPCIYYYACNCMYIIWHSDREESIWRSCTSEGVIRHQICWCRMVFLPSEILWCEVTLNHWTLDQSKNKEWMNRTFWKVRGSLKL